MSSNESAIRVFVVEDHPEVLRMMCKLIRRHPELQVCGEALSAEAALPQIEACAPAPDVVLVDISLSGMN
jgi:chemotaxis response regulator CheB